MTGMGEIVLIRRGEALIPAAAMFLEDLLAITENKPIVAEWRYEDDESDKQRRWLFFVLRELIKAGSWDGDEESLLDHLKFAVKHTRPLGGGPQFGTQISDLAERILSGEDYDAEGVLSLAKAVMEAGPRIYAVPRSIAKGQIRPDHFRRFIARVEDYIARIFGVDVNEFRKRSAEYAGAPRERSAAGPRHSPPSEPREPVSEQQSEPGAGGTEAVREPPISLEDELAALALKLGAPVDLKAFEEAWATVKQTAEAKELNRAAPKLLKAIVDAGRNKASGKLDDVRYRNIVNLAINEATSREAA